MPKGFTTFTIRFLNGEDTVFEENFVYGDQFAEEQYPDLMEYDGQYAYWENKNISPVHRNVSVHAVYRAYMPSLSADAEEGRPKLLLGGEFYPDSALFVKELTEEEKAPVLGTVQKQLSGYTVRKVYSYEIVQSEPLRENVSLHVKNDLAADSIMVLSDGKDAKDGVMKAKTEGSYLAVKTAVGSKGYIIVMEKVCHYYVVVLALCAVVVMIFIAIFLWKRKSKHVTIAEDAEEEKDMV